jgi:hypothetical protein
LSNDIKIENQSIIGFVTKCKLKMHSLIFTKKKDMGVLRWDKVEITNMNSNWKLIYINEKGLVVNANCSQDDACEQTMGNLIHKAHHGLDLGQIHLSPSYNIFRNWQWGYIKVAKEILKNQEGVPKLSILSSCDFHTFMES